MNLFEVVKISIKAIRVNKVRTFLTMLGVIIGVASVIILVSLVSGLGKTIKYELNSIGANLLFIFPGNATGGRGPGGVVTNKMEFRFADLLKERIPEISQIVPAVQSIGRTKYLNKETKDTTIIGVTGNFFETLSIDIVSGRKFSDNESGNVVIIGDSIKESLFKSTNAVGKEITVKGRRYKIIGVAEKRGSFLGADRDNIAILTLASARNLLGVDKPNWFYVKIADEASLDSAKKKISKILYKELNNDDNFTVSSQEDTLQMVGRILGVLSIGLGGVAAISLFVGGIGIMNMMLVSVTERTREIGLRKALGAKRRDILLQFLTEAIILSLIGGSLGVLFGIGVSKVIDRFIATEISVPYVLMAFIFSAGIGIIFGIAPAIRASRLSPIEALRYE